MTGSAPLNEGLLREYGTTLELRIGVNTGEVVTGTEERLATGDAVNVTARLEQAAQPGEILIGAETRALVRDAVVVEEVGLARAEGQGGAGRGVPSRRRSRRAAVAPAHGRDGRQGARAGSLAGRACRRPRPTVPASCSPCSARPASGSRAWPTSSSPGSTAPRSCSGSCLSYGEGITYWPVVEVLRQLLGPAPEQRLAGLGLDPSASRAIQAVLGEGGVVASVEEIAWAMRRAARGVRRARPARRRARRHPLGRGGLPRSRRPRRRPEPRCADPPVLHGAARAARPAAELGRRQAERDDGAARAARGRRCRRARRPPCSTGRRPMRAAREDPRCSGGESALRRGDGRARARVAGRRGRRARRRSRRCSPPGSISSIPPSGRCSGAARSRGASSTGARCRRSRRTVPSSWRRSPRSCGRELLRPDGSLFPGEDAFRFRHLLIRDAAYDALPKATRAALHERFAGWIAERGADLVELDEVVGYHLEQAYRYRVELGPGGEAARELCRRVPPSAWRQRERRRLHAAMCARRRACSTALSPSCPPAMPAGWRFCRRSGGPCSRPVSGRERTRFSRRPCGTREPQATAGWPPTAASRSPTSASSRVRRPME